MTKLNTNLTANELKAAMILVTECVGGMGGERPSDLENDEYTWVDAKVLKAHGYSAQSANATFGSLKEKGFIEDVSKNEWCLATSAWRWLDTQWDAYQNPQAAGGEFPVEEAPVAAEPAIKLGAQEGPELLTNRQLIDAIWLKGKIAMPVAMNGNVCHIIIEKTDLVEELKTLDPDAIASWAFYGELRPGVRKLDIA